jgi:hypothetical protein
MSGNTSATGGYIPEVPPPPPTGREVTAALQQAVVGITGLPGDLVRPRWQPMPPSQPDAAVTWASVGITHVEADDYPYIVHDGTTRLPGAVGPGVDRMQRHATLTVLATFYGPEAEDVAGVFRDGLHVQQNWEPMHLVGMKLREVRDLARNAELVNQQWIDRLDIQLEMRGQIDRTYPVLNLAGAQIALKTDKPTETDITIRQGWDDKRAAWDDGITVWDQP